MKIDFFRRLAFADPTLSHRVRRLYAVVLLGIVVTAAAPLGRDGFAPILWGIQLAVMLVLAYAVYSFVRDVHQALARAENALDAQNTRHFQEQLRILHQAGIRLALAHSVDDFCRTAVELIRDLLGFDRAGIWIYDLETRMSVGTFGTDKNGQTVDERHYRFPIETFPFDDTVLKGQQQAVLRQNIALKELSGETLTVGWLAQIAMWDGSRVVGYLSVDNALHQRPIQPYQMEILALFGTQLGHLYTRQKSDLALRESEERYRILAQLVSDYAYSFRVNPDNTYELEWITEEPFYQITGIRRHEITNTISLYHPDDLPQMQQDMRALLAGQPNNRDYRIFTKSGEMKWVNMVRYPVWDEKEKRVVRFYGAGKEITGRKQAEDAIRLLNAELEHRVEQRTAQLMMVNRELEAFAYSVSHDLRAPLRSIDGFSRMALEVYGDKLDTTGQDYLHRIRSATQRTGDMIDALLALSRVTRSELRLKTVDLSAMAQHVLTALAESDPARSVKTIIMPELTAEGDSRLLHVLLENLLGNAWKYSSKNPEAVIEFGCEIHLNNDEQVFYVRDNGTGFDMAYVDKLFGAFRRLHTEREFPGTGIGLATVQRIVHRHNGTIWAASEPDKGSTFYFTLHASDEQDKSKRQT